MADSLMDRDVPMVVTPPLKVLAPQLCDKLSAMSNVPPLMSIPPGVSKMKSPIRARWAIVHCPGLRV
jgi:hypothetical protein